MSRDRNAILCLCSHVCLGAESIPLTTGEYRDLAGLLSRVGKTPGDLFDFSPGDYASLPGFDIPQRERVLRLLDRYAALSSALGRYRSMGIDTVTRTDEHYPGILKQKLSDSCPPLLYYAGDLSLSEKPCIGYVGSRNIEPEDVDFGVQTVRKTSARGYGVVSGGARGVDTVCATEALQSGSFCVEYLPDSLSKKVQRSDAATRLQAGRLLLMSAAAPDAPFRTSFAMMRNRFIYAQSVATVVVRANLGKGGTWSGATDSLRNGLCPVLCWDHPYPGNRGLIDKGAIPIDDTWDGMPPCPAAPEVPTFEQASFF